MLPFSYTCFARDHGVLVLLMCYPRKDDHEVILSAGMRDAQPGPGYEEVIATPYAKAQAFSPRCKIIEEAGNGLCRISYPVWFRRLKSPRDLEGVFIYTEATWRGRAVHPMRWPSGINAGATVGARMTSGAFPELSKLYLLACGQNTDKMLREMRAQWIAFMEPLERLGWSHDDREYVAHGPVPVAELELTEGPLPARCVQILGP